MILVDSSIWIGHFRARNELLADFLRRDLVLTHSWIIGEVALGHIRDRLEILALLGRLPRAVLAREQEAAALIESARLYGQEIGYVDAGLLASTRLTPGAAFWTGDARLRDVAARIGVAASL